MNFFKPCSGLLIACLLAAPCVLTLPLRTQAEGKPAKQTKSRKAYVPVKRVSIETFSSSIMDDKLYSKMIKDAESRSKRATANADSFDESKALSDEYRNLRSEIIGGKEYRDGKETGKVMSGVTNADQLSQLVNKYDNDQVLNALPRDARLMAIQLVSIKPFKGFIFRAKAYFGRHSAIRTMIVTSLRNTAQGINVFLPTDQWTAGFAYVTEPFADMGDDIDSDADLENFIANQLLPSVAKNSKRIEVWAQNIQPIYWDNKVYYAKANFFSEKDRYLRLGVAEQRAIVSASYATLASMYSVSAYSLSGLADSVSDMAKNFGVDSSAVANVAGFFGNGPMGISSKERFEILRSHPNLFKKVSQQHMIDAYGAWISSARWARSAWIELSTNTSKNTQSNSAQIQNVVDPNTVLPFARIINTSLNNMDILLEPSGEQKVRSAVVQADVIDVNLHRFFHESPESMSELYPVDFDGSDMRDSKTINGKKVYFRNYLNGAPIAWSYENYRKYFPQTVASEKPSQTKDVTKFARVLSQTWGGWIVGLPLSTLVF